MVIATKAIVISTDLVLICAATKRDSQIFFTMTNSFFFVNNLVIRGIKIIKKLVEFSSYTELCVRDRIVAILWHVSQVQEQISIDILVLGKDYNVVVAAEAYLITVCRKNLQC